MPSASSFSFIAFFVPITFNIWSNLSSNIWFWLINSFWVSATPPANAVTLDDIALYVACAFINFPSMGVKKFTIVSLRSMSLTGTDSGSSFFAFTAACLTSWDAFVFSNWFFSSASLWLHKVYQQLLLLNLLNMSFVMMPLSFCFCCFLFLF